MKCRKQNDDIKTEALSYLGISLGNDLLIAQAVSGTQVARAWLGLCYETWEPYVTNTEERSDPDRSPLHQRWR